MMKTIHSILICLLFVSKGFAQADTSKWLRSFPITDYMVKLDDSTWVVQLEMPDGLKIPEKQLGLLWGVYEHSREDVVQKGYGKCHLIKGNYYYFAIAHNESGKSLQKGDLIYTFMPRPQIFYGQIVYLASHFIRLKDVYGESFYDRYNIFLGWSEADEKKLLDSMVKDIRFTGRHFLDQNSEMNREILTGTYKGQRLLEVMVECTVTDLKKFFDYIIARPRMYAGREWKVSEIFATWLSEGAPEVK